MSRAIDRRQCNNIRALTAIYMFAFRELCRRIAADKCQNRVKRRTLPGDFRYVCVYVRLWDLARARGNFSGGATRSLLIALIG